MSRYRPGTYIALFIGAHFAHHLLTALVVPMLPYIRDGFGLTYAQSGMVVSAFTLSYGIGQLPGGWLADCVGRGYLITIGIAGLSLAAAVAGLTVSYAGLIAALIAMGIAGGGYHPSAAPLITASVPPERRGRALGLHLVGGSASHFVTPLLGAAIASRFGWRGSFLGIAGPVFLFGLAFFLILRSRGQQLYSSETSPGSEVGRNFDERQTALEPQTAGGSRVGEYEAPARKRRGRTIVRVSVFLIMTSTVGASIASLAAFVPLYLVDVFGLSEGLAAGALSLFFATGVVAAPVGGTLSDYFGPVPILIALSLAAGPLFMLGALAPSALLFAVFLIGLGITTFIRMPVSEAYLSEDVPQRLRSRVLGVYFFAGMEASGILTAILGYLIDMHGFTAAFSAFGLVLTVIAGAAAAALRAMHRAPAP